MVRIRRVALVSMSVYLTFSAAGVVSSSGQTAWGAQVIQCSDLPELVKTYSPQVQMERALYETRLGRHESAREEMMETRHHLRKEAEDMEKNGDSDGASNYRTQAKVLEGAAKDTDEQIRSAEGSSNTMSLHKMEDTMMQTAQSLMGTYHSLRAEQEGVLAEAELMQGKYEKAIRQAGLGMISQAAADEVGKAAITVANKVQLLQDDMERVGKEFLAVTGHPGDPQTQIGMLPAPGQSRMDGIIPEVDKWKALGNNHELRQQRGGSSGGTIKEYHVHQRTVEEGEAAMYGQMDILYQNILTGCTMQQSVVTAQAARKTEWKAASNKMDLGMLSRQEYPEARSSYLNGAAAETQADMNFQQAIDMYDWTVKGLVATNRILLDAPSLPEYPVSDSHMGLYVLGL